ncbi:hypothetical protein N665_0681s0005 [Sinapis alba]|nr:hypothetical protein N665_0681s0005 [Sinapis alba]
MLTTLILVTEENGDMRDPDGHLRNAAVLRQQNAIRPAALQRHNFEIKSAFFRLVAQTPYHGLRHEHPIDHLELRPVLAGCGSPYGDPCLQGGTRHMAEAYWAALCEGSIPPPQAQFPSRPPSRWDRSLPSKSLYPFLDTVREFGRVPEDMEFRIPRQGERADDPLVVYFTCYKAHIVHCRLWFPILEIIVRTLNRFCLSISQINLTGLQHLLGILVLSYEHGVPLSVDHFEALLKPLVLTGGIYRLTPCAQMSIIRETFSNGHVWEKCFFFVTVNSASVEESYIPVFRSEWGRYETKPLPPFPDDMIVVRDLLQTGSFFWTSFTPKRVQKALKHHQSRSHPEMVVEEGSKLAMDELLSRYILMSQGNARPSKGKGVDLGDLELSSDDFSLPRWPSNFASGNESGASDFSLPDCNFDDLFKDLPAEFDFPTTKDGQARSKAFAEGSRMVNAGLLSFNSALEASYQEARLCHFKAERAETRRGKREVIAVVAGRAAQFKDEFGKLKEAQELMGDFRECRGDVGALSQTTVAGNTFQVEMDTITSYMGKYEGVDAMVPPLEEKVLGCWDPIPVSPDIEETMPDVTDEGVEGNQSFGTFGHSMSGNFDLDP